MFCPTSSTTAESGLFSPPSSPCRRCQLAVEKIHSWSRIPPSPSGFSRLWLGPATNPSIEIAPIAYGLNRQPCQKLMCDVGGGPRPSTSSDAGRKGTRAFNEEEFRRQHSLVAPDEAAKGFHRR